MELDFNSCDESFNHYRETYEKLLKKTLEHLALNFNPFLSVTLVDNDFIQKINCTYRHIDRPTDVISFAFIDDSSDKDKVLRSGTNVVLGEIYISLDQAKRQAQSYGHSLDRELKFLFVHGLLHLLGYDHTTEKDEKVMFSLQDEILPSGVL